MNRITSYEDFINCLQQNKILLFGGNNSSTLYTINQLEIFINKYRLLYGPTEIIDTSLPIPFTQKIINVLFSNEQRPDFEALLQSKIEVSSVLLRWTNNNGGGLVVNTPESRARGIFFVVYHDTTAYDPTTYDPNDKEYFKPILPYADNFIFDLDLTLTIKHTGGLYNGGDVHSIMDVSSVKDMLLKLKYKNVFLCSRGQYNSCYMLLKNAGLLGFFCGIYAAKNNDGDDKFIFESEPTNDLHLEYDVIGLNNKEWEKKWAELKSKFISAIREKYYNHPDNLSNIYFFDDTKLNVDFVNRDNKDNNIVNAFYIETKNYNQTIDIVNHILIPDESKYTQGSVSKAIAYFSSNPYKITRIYSGRAGKWYYNPNPEKPTEFLEMPIQFKPSRYLSSSTLKGGKRKSNKRKIKNNKKHVNKNTRKNTRRMKIKNKNKKHKYSKKHKNK